jgi:hypothetical protein
VKAAAKDGGRGQFVRQDTLIDLTVAGAALVLTVAAILLWPAVVPFLSATGTLLLKGAVVFAGSGLRL